MKLKASFLVSFTILFVGKYSLAQKIDCQFHYDKVDEKSCLNAGCLWEDHEKLFPEEPKCHLDPRKIGYNYAEQSTPFGHALQTPEEINKNRNVPLKLNLRPDSSKLSSKISFFSNVYFKYDTYGDNVLRFKIQDQPEKSSRDISEILPWPVDKPSPVVLPAYSLEFFNESSAFGFKVLRKSDNVNETNESVWDSSFGGALLFSDQLLQITTRFSTKFLYGMGENTHRHYRHNLNYKTWPIFNFDQPPDDLERNAYGTHPFMMFVNQTTGKAYGIYFMNTNAMEYSLTPDHYLTYKTSGGILDFFIIVGDNPEHVVRLYQTKVIPRPMMPPFWGLGFQLSRYGYKNTSEVRDVINRNIEAGIPLDVQYVDIDYMDVFDDFTYDNHSFKELPSLINQTRKEHGLRWTFIIDVAIQGNDTNYKTFQDGYDQNVYVRWDPKVPKSERGDPDNVPLDKGVFWGRVWPRGPSAFPDFFNSVTAKWWSSHLQDFHGLLNYDGIWIDMNEPANFDNHYEVCPANNCYMSTCPHNSIDFPDIKLKAVWVQNRNETRLSYRTLCLSTIHTFGNVTLSHYDVHNLYSYREAIATYNALKYDLGKKRPFVLSRSTHAGSGAVTAHWTGDNTSSWDHLRRSLLQMFEFNLFGIPWVGADICGFQHETTPELCLRWHQLGAFYSFARNHNDIPNKVDQDPAVWKKTGHPEVTEAALASLRFRYRHLFYLHTLHYLASRNGSTVFRPMFHEFPQNKEAYEYDEQFMWGPSILVAPILYQGRTLVHAYLPVDEIWYPFVEHEENLQRPQHGHFALKSENYTRVAPIFFRSGSIIPEALINETTPIRNTDQIRKAPLRLNVYLGFNEQAAGSLYWESNDESSKELASKYFTLSFRENRLVIQCNFATPDSTVENTELDEFQLSEIRLYNHTEIRSIPKLRISLENSIGENEKQEGLHPVYEEKPELEEQRQQQQQSITIEYEQHIKQYDNRLSYSAIENVRLLSMKKNERFVFTFSV